ncbi:MAG: NAD(P)H-dependent oxidoreductase [Selenomonas sp.]|nr:flavodoxin [uncultured Mitsuokella sp.]MBQ1621221.1 NAD(P)H-dependent oxidoreductase [Selenomonas sp.]
MKKVLIVYYTWSNGNTEKIAGELQRATRADLEQISMVHPYMGSYEEVVAQGKREVESGFLPEIQPLAHDLSQYEVVAVGTPTWWYTMAPAVKSFFHDHDLSGKEVIFFQTHGGWPGHTLKDMAAACAGATEGPSMTVQFDSTGGSQQVTAQEEVDAWLAEAKAFLS